jgi:hypothetical protein
MNDFYSLMDNSQVVLGEVYQQVVIGIHIKTSKYLGSSFIHL